MDAEARDLLARINRELEEISETMHEQARRRGVLQEAATRLRTGEHVAIVEMRLLSKNVPGVVVV